MIRRHLHNFFIPHEGNEYRPHSLREESVLMFGAAAVLLFAGALLNTYFAARTDFYAAIVPSVLADFANVDRRTLSLGPLQWNPVLAEAARGKAEDMAQKGYFAHTSPEGTTPWSWFKKAGYRYRYAGENLAVYFSDSWDVHTAWMDSAGHRANILSGKFTEIGIAAAKGGYQGRETIFVVELFGKPQEDAGLLPEAVLVPPVVSGIEKAPPTEKSREEVASAESKSESELFIALPGEDKEVDASLSDVRAAPRVQYSSIVERTAATPRSNLRLSYFILFVIIAFALFLGVFVEIRRQHSLHIAYGISLLAFLSLLYYAGEAYVFTNVFII